MKNTTLYVNSNTSPIIENCRNVRFGISTLHLKTTTTTSNIISNDIITVKDFDWLRPDEQSPNWTFINVEPILDDTFPELSITYE